jgi:hypothetical protein
MPVLYVGILQHQLLLDVGGYGHVVRDEFEGIDLYSECSQNKNGC